jgi:hypothetical protein
MLKNLTEQAASTPEVGVIKKSVGQGHFQQILEHLPHLIWTTTPSGSHGALLFCEPTDQLTFSFHRLLRKAH